MCKYWFNLADDSTIVAEYGAYLGFEKAGDSISLNKYYDQNINEILYIGKKENMFWKDIISYLCKV